VQAAMPLAEQGKLVTFGIVPTVPETGYGYIQQGISVSEGASTVAAFVEKPHLELAQQYLASSAEPELTSRDDVALDAGFDAMLADILAQPEPVAAPVIDLP
ncbi:sugar phosphate nucleotidyltransferase, partial [Aeromonas hydrophila]|uniref:sugar phosphate nucleotidyltransferase n=1 Tax=Aeromonas hydrophila TaxID=644 RepID=UPI0036DDFC8E